MRHIVNVRKSVQLNHLVPSYTPAHSGPCVHPRPSHSGLLGCGKWVWGPATKWPAYAVRQKALAAQIQAFGSLFCAAQSRPRPGLRLRITWPVYGEVFRSLKPSLRRWHTRTGMHADPRARQQSKHAACVCRKHDHQSQIKFNIFEA